MRLNKFLLLFLSFYIQYGYSQKIVEELDSTTHLASNYNLEKIQHERRQLNLEIKQLQINIEKDTLSDYSKVRIEELFFKKQLLLEIELLLKEKELKDEQQKTKRYTNLSIGLSLSILFILILAIIIFLLFKEKAQRKAFSLELNRYKLITLNQQLNPHFIYNALSSVQHFVLTSDKTKANEYITDFAKLMRIILANSQKDLISINDELEAIGLYLKLELLRFNNQFTFKINCDNEILNYKIPSFLLQPFIENALWHGLLHKKEIGMLAIDLKKVKDIIFISIEDNGIGREQSFEINRRKKVLKDSFGILLSQQRVDLLNKELYKFQAKLKIIDLKNGETPMGTKVEIELPILN